MYISAPFERRLKKIVRRHHRLSYGSVRKVTSSGLIVTRPRIFQPKFPLKWLVLVLVACFAFKCYLYLDLGASDYNARLAGLRDGTRIEQAGAWVMQVDPATAFVARVVNNFGL